MRLNGAKYKRDKTGLIQVTIPWEVSTVEDCETFIPDEVPLGLPLIDRSAEEFTVGTWTLNLTYEGGGSDNVSFDTDAKLELEIDASMSQDPIQSHPNFIAIAAKYGWNKDKGEFAPYITKQGTAGTGTALSGAQAGELPNPLYGTESFLNVGAVFRITYTAKTAPQDILDGVGTVFTIPPGYDLLGIPHPVGRNWLKLAPKVNRRGNATRTTLEYMLSGPWGWVKDVYGKQQLIASKTY